MKALVIAPQPFFSPRGTPISVYYRTLIMAELGIEVDLLTYGEGQDVAIPGVRIIRIPHFAFLGQVKIGPSYLKIFLDALLILWSVALLTTRKYDFVHAHEEAIFFCRFLKPLFGFKLVYDMHSSLPQQLHNFRFTTSRLLTWLFQALERHCIEAADAVITICPDLEKQVKELIGDVPKHLLIENSIFDPIKLASRSSSGTEFESERASWPQTLPMPTDHRRLVIYAGTLEPYQGIEILIDAFRRVRQRTPDARLLIVGGTASQIERYSSLASKYELGEACCFTGRVSPARAKEYCSRAAVLVSPRSSGTNTPLKIYELLATGIPILATNIYSHTQVLNDQVAFLVAPEPEAMATGILKALDANGDGRRRAHNARQLYEQKYSRPHYVRKMQQLLELLS